MKKLKKYEKPSIKVVQLQNQLLLTGSGEKKRTIQDYDYHDLGDM